MVDLSWEDLDLPPVTFPAACQALLDKAAALDDQLAKLIERRKTLIAQLPAPLPPILPPELQKLVDAITKLDGEIKAKRAELKQARDDLQACTLAERGPLCVQLRELLEGLNTLLRFHQKEITRKVDMENPRPKDVIMKDIRQAQAAIKLVKQVIRLVGC